jgi:hypothetical protein
MAFRGPFCLGVTQKTGEAKEHQRDAKETAKKSDGAKTRSWAGATPLFGTAVPNVTREVAPAHRRKSTAPSVLAPSPQGEEKRRELEEKKEQASAKGL